MSHTTSRATSQGTRTRDLGEVVNKQPTRCEVVDDVSRDKLRDVLKQQDARHR
jgi:hypothetical protein